MNMVREHMRSIRSLGDATPQENTVLTGASINQGDTGDAVGLLQQQLKVWGFDPGGADGIYGPNTAGAVTALQRKLGVTPTGNFDEQTQESVLKDLQSTSSVIRQNQTVTKVTTSSGAGKTTTIKTSPASPSSIIDSPWVAVGGVALVLGGLYWWWRSRKYTVPARADRNEPIFDRSLPPRHVMRRSPRRSKRTASRQRRSAR